MEGVLGKLFLYRDFRDYRVFIYLLIINGGKIKFINIKVMFIFFEGLRGKGLLIELRVRKREIERIKIFI